MRQEDIKKLLKIRAAWDKYKASGPDRSQKDTDAYFKVLWSYGIERRDEIAKFNDEMCLALLREYRTIGGQCDFCVGYDGEPPCLTLYKDRSCSATKTPKIEEELMYHSTLVNYRSLLKAMGFKTMLEAETALESGALGDMKGITEDGRSYVFCPRGHGYYNKYERRIIGDIFDILWEV
jgi:hypothetical protein